ncbi:hypothetical protein [Hymenobacter sediminicola]|uniref:Uncharacterized protein n=1 Tax=Hymenobacter sediminicola TaxID=2761579 RepID=A0A7G7WB92_9BACT|nr:hypothetical protein [Hymenobacter sediminicola]QNH63635.1 hypothetical protein H4317_07520 [Hymenobacter sediminicola]
MRFEIIFKEGIKLYPSEIDISDGYFTAHDGFYSQKLIDEWEKAEKRAISISEWHELICWNLYQVMHNAAKEDFMNNVFCLRPAGINPESVKIYLEQHLNGPEYKDMLLLYEH